jgi:hypothetical protein
VVRGKGFAKEDYVGRAHFDLTNARPPVQAVHRSGGACGAATCTSSARVRWRPCSRRSGGSRTCATRRTVVVHVIYAMPVCWPSIVLPTYFMYKFLVGPREPPVPTEAPVAVARRHQAVARRDGAPG